MPVSQGAREELKDEASVRAGRHAVEQRCISASCGAAYPITDTRSECGVCGNLLDVRYDWPLLSASELGAAELKRLWLERKASREPRDLSGVWRFRELIPFLPADAPIVTLREGNTPTLESPSAARYAGLDTIFFKHQGFNPTGSFKDNGMTAGVTQASALGRKLVACVSTGNTSASMAAYAAYGGLRAVLFIPSGQIAAGKLAQALEYGALTIQVEGNFDETWKVVFGIIEETGIYLLNSVNPFRVEGQKMIVVEMMEQLGWEPPDWIVLPGGNLGNTSAFGKGLREMYELGLIPRLPRLGVIQAEGAAPLYSLMQRATAMKKSPLEVGIENVAHPRTLATAIKIGAPASWRKALRELEATRGVVESVSEQEIADAKAVIGRSGIGCEPASAASLAGAKKLVARGMIRPHETVVGVLTGNVLKDPTYSLAYHQGTLALQTSEGQMPIRPNFGNQPVSVPADREALKRVLAEHGR